MYSFKGKLFLSVIILVMAIPTFSGTAKLEVKIEKLEPMQMVVFPGSGEEPELMASKKLRTWTKSKNLQMDSRMHRTFGFTTKKGYNLMVTVERDMKVGRDMKVKKFPGGIFATTTCKGIKNIPGTWKKLREWYKRSSIVVHSADKCASANDLFLEENLSPPGTPEDEMAMKLYFYIND